jgi:hypothetical protein
MYRGYLELGGTEIANALRVGEYVRKNAPHVPLNIDLSKHARLNEALGEPAYESPAADGAPWIDPADPSTQRFLGFYPVDISGIDGSTRSAATVEAIGNGGITGRVRHGSKAIRVTGLLVAEDALALEAGATWLSRALDSDDCGSSGGSCAGAQLCFYAARPEVCDEWEPTYQAGFSRPVGVTEASSPLILRDGGEHIFKARLDEGVTSSREGAIIEWGTVLRDNTNVWDERYGPVVLARTNRVANPFFLTSTDLWSISGGDTLERVAAGGVDDMPYARVVPGAGVATLSTVGMAVLAGKSIASFDLRGLAEGVVTARMLDADSNLLLEADFTVSDEWDRYSMPYSGPDSPATLVIEGDAEFHVGRAVVETGLIELPPFHGSMPWTEAAAGFIVGGMDAPEYVVGWVGQPNESASVMQWQGDMTIGVPFGSDTFALQTGACNVWPRIDAIQGELTGGFAAYALRLRVPTERQVVPYERTMYDVTCVSGPTPLRELEFDNGTRMRMVEFILVAGVPFVHGSPLLMVYPATGAQLGTVPWTDPECPSEELVAISDPLCPPPPAPPRPPAIAVNCVPPETTWERHWFQLPGSSISSWSEMVPQITVRADVAPVRHMRIRFYPNPFGYAAQSTRRVNRVSNPRVDPDNGTWGNVQSTNGTGARIATDMPDGSDGFAWRFTTTSTAVAQSSGARTSLLGYNEVAEGVPTMLSIYGRTNAARNLKLRYVFYELDTIAQVGGIVYADVKAVAANTWERFSALVTPPAGAGRVSISVVADGPDLPAGQWVEGTWASAVEEDELTPFFAGDSPTQSGVYYSWAGEPGMSESIELSGIEIDPCSWCSEFVLSYLPAGGEAFIDGVLERSTVSLNAGEPQPYDTFVVSTGGEPLEWSSLSCGIDYLVAFDFPTGSEAQVTVGLDILRRL